MRIHASSSGSTSAKRSKKGPNTVEKLASVPPISTSGLCTELCARSHRSVDGFADEAIHTSTDLDRAMVDPARHFRCWARYLRHNSLRIHCDCACWRKLPKASSGKTCPP